MCFWSSLLIPLLLMHLKQLSLPQFRLIPWIVSHFFGVCSLPLLDCPVIFPHVPAPPSLNLSTAFQVFCPSLFPPSASSAFPATSLSWSVRQIVAWVSISASPIYLTSVPELAGSAEWTRYTRQQRSSSVSGLQCGVWGGVRGWWMLACSTMKTYQ